MRDKLIGMIFNRGKTKEIRGHVLVMRYTGLQLRESEQTIFCHNFLISQPNSMM